MYVITREHKGRTFFMQERDVAEEAMPLHNAGYEFVGWVTTTNDATMFHLRDDAEHECRHFVDRKVIDARTCMM